MKSKLLNIVIKQLSRVKMLNIRLIKKKKSFRNQQTLQVSIKKYSNSV